MSDTTDHTTPDQLRCSTTWTPPDAHGPVRCTYRGDVQHPHTWSAHEEYLWEAASKATDPLLGPDGTDVVDFNPERCPHTWTPLGRYGPDRLRCTARADEGAEHSHRWDSREQERWIDETRRVLFQITDAQVDAAWTILERCGLTLQHRSHVRAALEAAAKA